MIGPPEIETIKKFGLGYSGKIKAAFSKEAIKKGYDKQVLISSGLSLQSSDSIKIIDRFKDRVIFPIQSYSGRTLGFGGRALNVNVKAKYKLAGKKLTIEISATVDRETPLNMGQHNYFNLCSQSEENYNICNHLLYLNASSFTETDQNLIPTGKILSTEGTKMHFYKKKKIGNTYS